MKIQITDDFDPKKIIRSGQCFRATEINKNTYRFITGRHLLHLSRVNNTTWEADCTPYRWKQTWHEYFDFAFSYKKARKQIPAHDAFLQNAATDGAGLRLLKQDPFEMIITFIISQRKSIPAIRSSVETLCQKAGKAIQTENDFFYTFPRPKELQKLSMDDLKSASLGYRAKYIYATTRMIASGKIKLSTLHNLSDETLHDTLTTLPGVGAKVANCISLFAFHRLTAAPVDVWIDRVISMHYKGNNPFSQLPYPGLMQQYMFYYAQIKKRKP